MEHSGDSTLKITPPVPQKPPDDTLPPGSLLNHEKYRVERVLGRGGFGVTYMALDQSLGLRVAVKECLPRNAAWRNDSAASVRWGLSAPEQETALENFVREARKMAKIDQIPGVVRVREYFYDNDTAYIVMDYVHGETLAQRLSRTGPMDAAECFRLLSPVMGSLALAHGRGLVHRDISPNNIMIERDSEKVWLLDLGAAKDMGARLSAPNVSNGTQIVGTPGYTPLEQYDPDGKIGPWTDVYAMSSLFFRCMTGQIPPPSTSRAQKDAMPELLRTMPGKVGAVLLKGLAQNSEKRYQTMTELRDALEKAIPKQKVKKPKPEKLKQFSEKLTVIKAAFVILALCAVVALAFPFVRSKPAEIVASGECGHEASWTLDTNGLLTISGTGDMEDYNYDSDADFCDTPWFDNKEAIFNVRIFQEIANVGQYAFYGCENLRRVDLADSVTKIGWSAFEGCSHLTSVSIPDSVTLIETYAFCRCSALTEVSIPNSVTKIGWSVFSDCSRLFSVKISDGIKKIENYTFSSCTALSNVVLPDGITEIGGGTFSYCSALNNIVIPDTVAIIGNGAFLGCKSLSNVSVPSTATIADDAFNENTVVTRR